MKHRKFTSFVRLMGFGCLLEPIPGLALRRYSFALLGAIRELDLRRYRFALLEPIRELALQKSLLF